MSWAGRGWPYPRRSLIRASLMSIGPIRSSKPNGCCAGIYMQAGSTLWTEMDRRIPTTHRNIPYAATHWAVAQRCLANGALVHLHEGEATFVRKWSPSDAQSASAPPTAATATWRCCLYRMVRVRARTHCAILIRVSRGASIPIPGC